MRSFLGLCSYYRKFIYKFSDIARPLHALTEANKKFLWNSDCTLAFGKLKEALTSAPILSYPNDNDFFTLDTDASNTGMGAVLSQEQENTEKVISYYSKTFSAAQRRYCVTRRALLAIVNSIKHYHHYLYGKPFRVRTDHGSLTWLLNFKNPEGQLARWFEFLSAYDFKIEHRAGRSHNNADALSRRPCFVKSPDCKHCLRAENNYELKQKSPTLANPTPSNLVAVVTRSQKHISDKNCENSNEANPSLKENDPSLDIKTLQEKDPDIREILKWVKNNQKPKWNEISHTSQTCKYYCARFDSLSLKDEILYHKWEDVVPRLQTILPRSTSKEVIQAIHCNITGGHLGCKKTLSKIRSKYFWHKMSQDVNFFVKIVINVQQENLLQKHIGPNYKNMWSVPLWKDGQLIY